MGTHDLEKYSSLETRQTYTGGERFSDHVLNPDRLVSQNFVVESISTGSEMDAEENLG